MVMALAIAVPSAVRNLARGNVAGALIGLAVVSGTHVAAFGLLAAQRVRQTAWARRAGAHLLISGAITFEPAPGRDAVASDVLSIRDFADRIRPPTAA